MFAQKIKIDFSKVDSSKLLHAQTEHICSGLLAFRQSEDQGLINLLKLMVEFGAKYGKFDPTPMLNSRQTISENVNSLYSSIQSEYAGLLRNTAHLKSFCLTTDGWTDSTNKNHFIDFTFTLIDGNFKLHHFQYDMIYQPESQTSENITKTILSLFADIGISPKRAKIVTDSAANYIKAGKNFDHHVCMCHRLNTAIEKAYTKSLQTNTYLKSADEAITGVIGYANRSNLQNKLPIKLKSGSQTRPWRRYSDRFKSIFESYEALEQKLPVFFYLTILASFIYINLKGF